MKFKELEKQAKAEELELKKQNAKKSIRRAARLVERTKSLLKVHLSKDEKDEIAIKELKGNLEKHKAAYSELLKCVVEDIQIVTDKHT